MIRTSSKLWKSAVLATMLALAVRDVEAGGRSFGGGFSARPSSNSGGSFGRGNSSSSRPANNSFPNNNSGFRAARSSFGMNSGNTNYTSNRATNTVNTQPVMNTYRSSMTTVANSTSSLPRTVLQTVNKPTTSLTNTVVNSSLGQRNVTSVPSLSRGTQSFASGPVNRGIASRFPKGLKTADARSVKDSLLKRMTGSKSQKNSGLAGAKPGKNKAKAILAAGVAVGVLGDILNSNNSGDVIVSDAETTTFVDTTLTEIDTTAVEQQTILAELPAISSEVVAAGSTEVQTIPSEYTLLIFNMTEQSMTYSIRAEGTKWGTYKIEAGQHHRFTVAQDAMEVQYANGKGEQLALLPGEHVYAFADLDGTVQICNADPDVADLATN